VKKLAILMIVMLLITYASCEKNYYKIVEEDSWHLVVDRKGKLINIDDPFHRRAGDSIRLYIDYDWNWQIWDNE